MPGLSLVVDFVGPPQHDPGRVYALAEFHVRAFFYWITFKAETREGSLLPGVFGPAGFANFNDWGNSQLTAFADLWRDWQPRIHVVGAKSYFKLIVRRQRDDIDLWGWALEWNRQTRVVGFFGRADLVQAALVGVPKPASAIVSKDERSETRVREEIPLDPASDPLFG